VFSDLESGLLGRADAPVHISPQEVINDFKIFDSNTNGEISAAEFIHALRNDGQLASKFGLSDDVLHENGSSKKYKQIFKAIDYDRKHALNVRSNAFRKHANFVHFSRFNKTRQDCLSFNIVHVPHIRISPYFSLHLCSKTRASGMQDAAILRSRRSPDFATRRPPLRLWLHRRPPAGHSGQGGESEPKTTDRPSKHPSAGDRRYYEKAAEAQEAEARPRAQDQVQLHRFLLDLCLCGQLLLVHG
jgi:hypothetical protein